MKIGVHLLCWITQVRWLSSKSIQIINTGEDGEKGAPPTLLVEIHNDAACIENSMGVSLKIKNKAIIWSNNLSSGYIAKGSECRISNIYTSCS